MLNCILFADFSGNTLFRRLSRGPIVYAWFVAVAFIVASGFAYSQDLGASDIPGKAPLKGPAQVKSQEGASDFSTYLQGLNKTEISTLSSSLKSAYTEVNGNRPPRKPKGQAILHIKSSGGVKFIKIDIDQKAKEEIEKQIPKVAEHNYKAMLHNFENELHKKATIPLCKENKTKVIQSVAQLTKQQENKLQPVLMLQKDLIPQDEKIAYGITTKVMSFEVSTLAGLPDFLKMTGFSCLPVRMHVSKKGLLLIEGEGAIKNYDQDEKGRLDKGVERLWQALKIRYRSEESSRIGDRLAEFEKEKQ
jgi:hypothetical protein